MHPDAVALIQKIGKKRPGAVPAQIFPAALAHAELSYALAGEDMALRRLLKRELSERPGVYVDIGCMSPYSLSNTLLFYCFGWSGLCVDANADFTDQWATLRPRDAFINVAVGDTEGTLFFHRHPSNPGMHMVTQTAAAPGADYESVPREVPVRRMDSMLAEHIGDRKIDFMTIDVEGSEMGVLKSSDWNRWRPTFVLMECNAFSFDQPRGHPTVSYLYDLGYKLTGKVGANVLMEAAA